MVTKQMAIFAITDVITETLVQQISRNNSAKQTINMEIHYP